MVLSHNQPFEPVATSRLSSQPDNPPTVNSQPRLFSVESILDQIEALSELEIDEQFPARGRPRSSDLG